MTAPKMKREEFAELQKLLPPVLPDFLAAQRWFGGKAHRIRAAAVADIIPFGASRSEALMVLARVEYETGVRETYLLPLLAGDANEPIARRRFTVLRGSIHGAELVLTDALRNEDFLLDASRSDRGASVFSRIEWRTSRPAIERLSRSLSGFRGRVEAQADGGRAKQ